MFRGWQHSIVLLAIWLVSTCRSAQPCTHLSLRVCHLAPICLHALLTVYLLCAGLTPAQLQMLISSPPEQVWRLAAQMGVFKQRRNGHVSAPLRQAAPTSFVGNGSSASQANYINAMAHLHQLHGHHSQNPPQTAAAPLGQTLPDGFAQQVNGGLLQQQILRQQQQQAQPQVTDAQRILLELGKTLAGLGITVEAAINAGLLGGLAVADVHTLCEAYAAEVQRMQLSGVQPQPHLAGQVFGNQAALKPEINVADLLARSGSGAGAAATNPAILAAARQQQQQALVSPWRCQLYLYLSPCYGVCFGYITSTAWCSSGSVAYGQKPCISSCVSQQQACDQTYFHLSLLSCMTLSSAALQCSAPCELSLAPLVCCQPLRVKVRSCCNKPCL